MKLKNGDRVKLTNYLGDIPLEDYSIACVGYKVYLGEYGTISDDDLEMPTFTTDDGRSLVIKPSEVQLVKSN